MCSKDLSSTTRRHRRSTSASSLQRPKSGTNSLRTGSCGALLNNKKMDERLQAAPHHGRKSHARSNSATRCVNVNPRPYSSISSQSSSSSRDGNRHARSLSASRRGIRTINSRDHMRDTVCIYTGSNKLLQHQQQQQERGKQLWI